MLMCLVEDRGSVMDGSDMKFEMWGSVDHAVSLCSTTPLPEKRAPYILHLSQRKLENDICRIYF